MKAWNKQFYYTVKCVSGDRLEVSGIAVQASPLCPIPFRKGFPQ
jgi:hypothetical protein